MDADRSASRAERYRRTHGGGELPLIRLHEKIAAGKHIDAESLQELSTELGIPAAAIRGARSFYTDLRDDHPTGGHRVCHGTSCELAGAERVHGALEKSHPCRSVYCLGYCDRAPAALDDHDRVSVFETGGASSDPLAGRSEPASLPAIRCLASRAIVTERIGRGDHSSFDAAWDAGVYRAVEAAFSGTPERVLRTMEESGERGRGGAGFPTGLKWRRCAQAAGGPRYVIANGDEGDPGSFIDRVLMEHDPHAILAGMICCAYATGASEGIVFIRSEYPAAVKRMRAAVEQARGEGLLGPRILGRDFAFDILVFPALGSYVCGEETAMLNAIEGRRGEVRLRPPYPVDAGLFGRPTVVNNVETLVNAAWIVANGAEAYSAMGAARSSGTKALCLSAGFGEPGIVEVEFGHSLADVIESAGTADASRPIEAVILGGPMGSILMRDEWDESIDYDIMAMQGIQLGHGGLVAIPEGSDWRRLLRHWLRFMRHESCGKCTPCRLGSAQALRIAERDGPINDTDLAPLLELMEEGSLCAFGQLMPGPVRTILRRIAACADDRGASDG